MSQGISDLKRHASIHLSMVISALALVGCSSPFGQNGYLRDRAGDYTQEEILPPLRVPEGIDARSLGDVLVIPPATRPNQALPRNFVVPRPGRRLTVGGNQYVIESNEYQQWLSATRAREQVWLGVMEYLNGLGVAIATSDPTAGLIITDWYDFGDDTNQSAMARTLARLVDDDFTENRFRFELRPGALPGITNIYVAHQDRSPGDQSAPDGWSILSSHSEQINNGVLGELLIFLARNETSASALASGQASTVVVEPGQDGNGNPVLTLRGQSYAQVWDAVAAALDKTGFRVIDRDRSTGLFYLEDGSAEQQEEKKTGGFWSGLTGGKEKAPADGQRNTLTVRVSNYPELVQLSVERDANTSAPLEVSKQVLEIVQENLQ